MMMIRSVGIKSCQKQAVSMRQVRLFQSQAPAQSQASNTTEASDKIEHQLNWEQFLKLRKQERRINLGSSIFTALLGSTASWGYISQIEIDPTQMIFGVDPFAVMVGGMILSTLLGYLFGPLVGGGIFNIKNRAILNEYYDKQKLFLKHIIKNRADPSRNSFQNPVPDYYGENIGTLQEYRNWLRDCNAYRRKSQEFL